MLISAFLLAIHLYMAVDLPPSIPMKRGDFAFRYHTPFTEEEMDWLSRFDVVVSGYFLPKEQTEQLHEAGSKLVHYVWLPAFNPDTGEAKLRNWGSILTEHPDWVLNADNPLFGHTGPKDAPAFYFDYASPGLRRWIVQEIIEMTYAHNYDGIFFDTTSFESVHPEAQKVFQERHPDDAYDRYVARVFAVLKESAPSLILFPNQGFRVHPYYLPYADYDLTESYMTATAWVEETPVHVQGKGLIPIKETYYARWYDPDNPGQSISHYCRSLITDPISQFGYPVKTYHLNYAHPRYVPTGEMTADSEPIFRPELDRYAIHYSMACALLLGHTSYCEIIQDQGVPRDDIYFVDLGKPQGENYTLLPNQGLTYRFYENGFVVVNDSGEDKNITFDVEQLPNVPQQLFDLFLKALVPDFPKTRTVTIPITRYAATGKTTSSGRIFVYVP